MFTGLIEKIGKVHALTPHATGARLTLAVDQEHDVRIGDSVAVNGCCLTIVDIKAGYWSADLVQESLQRTCLQELRVGDPVNLELAMRWGSRLGGHLVQGHVDGVGKITQKTLQPDGSMVVTVEASPALLRYVIEKGSITVDGVSLTVTAVYSNSFAFAMIPHTAKQTNLGWKQSGSAVNIEVDMMAKYVEKFLIPYPKGGHAHN